MCRRTPTQAIGNVLERNRRRKPAFTSLPRARFSLRNLLERTLSDPPRPAACRPPLASQSQLTISPRLLFLSCTQHRNFSLRGRRETCKCWAGWTDNGLKVRIQGLVPTALTPYIESYFESVQKEEGPLRFIENREPLTALPNTDAEIPWGTALR